jgi:hypothetical protein
MRCTGGVQQANRRAICSRESSSGYFCGTLAMGGRSAESLLRPSTFSNRKRLALAAWLTLL